MIVYQAKLMNMMIWYMTNGIVKTYIIYIIRY